MASRATRSKGKGNALRDSLFHGDHPSLAPSSPYNSRQPRSNNKYGPSSYEPPPSRGYGSLDSDGFNDLEFAVEAELKRRELGWTTSFPAEYHRAHQCNDYQRTLAFQEQLNLRNRDDQQVTNAIARRPSVGAVAAPTGPTAIASPSKQELELLKHVTMREGLLERLKTLATNTPTFPADKANELLQLLLQLRDASVSVVAALATWHCQSAGSKSLHAFMYQQQNYAVKMVADLNFLASYSALCRVLGVEPSRMKQNPFMMPAPISDRDFHEAKTPSPPRFSITDSVERVAEAEKYLVWCLVNLPDMSPIRQTEPPPATPSSPSKADLLTWQQRAEKQLRLLSMPLESPSGHAHVMDSSKMMKRKGYLPALPQSPPKTLTQLIQNVHKDGYVSPTKTSPSFASFAAVHDGITYKMTALDLEVLGSNDTPPHAIVTLVAASVLILLSPSDRIPKDLSWTSCRKMLSSGLKVVQRLEQLPLDNIPAFKWKALLPFLQNECYHPMFLMEYSCAAATLCAWVLHVLARFQANEAAASGADRDRQELMQELEQEDQPVPAEPSMDDELRPPSRATSSRSGKRVSIGNAEVLFINDNEPVSGDYSSRPGTSSSSSLLPSTPAGRRHVLLRTSPWTHRGVTYFVSFFLEKSGDEDDALSIKMYEPMSSVESQMFVSADDLLLDFGETASRYFQRREFGVLCDLILGRLDGLMTGRSTHSSSSQPCPEKPLQRQRQHQRDTNAGTHDVTEAAAVRIQCLARQQHAKKRVDGLREHRDATVRIQCAVRQRHARNKVKCVRFAKQQELIETQHSSATMIQSIARQRQAQKQVAHMKLLHRTPTGLPPERHDTEDDDAVDAMATLSVDETDPAAAAVGDDDAQVAEPPPDHHLPRETTRPETSASYASEQFEDDFEDDE